MRSILSKTIFCFAYLLLGWGCGGTSTECSMSSECFSGEVCSNGECVVPGENNANNANNVNNANNQNNVNNVANNSNNATNNTNNTNNVNNVNNVNNTTMGACIVDPFTVSCMDDGNDDFADSFDPGPQGCDNSGDFVPWEVSVSARMCGLETTDRYRQTLFPCDDIAFIMDVEFRPKEVCPDLYTIQISAQGNNCIDGGDDIQCEILEDGSINASIIIRPSISLGSSSIIIDKGEVSNVDFDYDLTVRVRQ